MNNIKKQVKELSEKLPVFPASYIKYEYKGKTYQLLKPEKGRIPIHYFIAEGEVLRLTNKVGVEFKELHKMFYNEELNENDFMITLSN